MSAKTRADICHRTDHIRQWLIDNQLRKYADYKITDMLNCHRKTLFNYRNGYTSPSVDVVEAILNELGYTLQVVPLDRRPKKWHT